jgi:hypothetical protein
MDSIITLVGYIAYLHNLDFIAVMFGFTLFLPFYPIYLKTC